MLKIILIIALAVFVLAGIVTLVQRFSTFFIVLGILCVLAICAYLYFTLRKAKDKHSSPTVDSIGTNDTLKDKSESKMQGQAAISEEAILELERHKKAEAMENELTKRKQRFSAELDAIPEADIGISEPVPRQYLKDIPDYGYSNITKTTKLSSIFPLVFLDVETTGLYPAKSEIVEVAAIKFDAGMNPTARFSTLCKPKKPIPPEITKINGITDDMVADKPNFHEIAPSLSRFLDGCNLAGHNLGFDLEFLYVHGTELPLDKKLYDTLELAQRTIKKSDIWNHKLGTVCDWYGIHRDDTHRALSDCYATSKIFTQLVFDKTSRMLDDGSDIVSDSDT